MAATVQPVYWLREAERPDVERYLREVAELGVREVFVGAHAISDLRPGALTDAGTLADALADTGVRLHTVHALFGGEMDLGLADAAGRSRALPMHERTLRLAAELGAQNVVFHLGGKVPEVTLAAARQSVERLLPVAEAAQVDLAVENLLPGMLGAEPEELAAVLAGLDSPRLGMCFDTGHAHLTGGCDRWLDALGSRVSMVHLHDNLADADTHLPPGLGTVDWPQVCRRLRACGYQGPWVSEARMQPEWTPARLHAHCQSMWP